MPVVAGEGATGSGRPRWALERSSLAAGFIDCVSLEIEVQLS